MRVVHEKCARAQAFSEASAPQQVDVHNARHARYEGPLNGRQVPQKVWDGKEVHAIVSDSVVLRSQVQTVGGFVA